jgi:hypothetical protein
MKRHHSRISLGSITRFAMTALLLAAPAHAGNWRFHLTPYAWATDMGVDVKLDGRQVLDKDIKVTDLLEDLETIFQARLEVTNGSFGVLTDVFDVTLADEANGASLPQSAGTADVTSKIGMTILDLAGTFDPKADRQGFGLLLGTRILDERVQLDATLMPAAGGSISQSHDEDDTMVDVLAGARFSKRFASSWGVQMQADASTGGTDYTWSLSPSLTYAFGRYSRYGINAGYRVMQLDFKDEAGVNTRMKLSGALLGFRISF